MIYDLFSFLNSKGRVSWISITALKVRITQQRKATAFMKLGLSETYGNLIDKDFYLLQGIWKSPALLLTVEEAET